MTRKLVSPLAPLFVGVFQRWVRTPTTSFWACPKQPYTFPNLQSLEFQIPAQAFLPDIRLTYSTAFAIAPNIYIYIHFKYVLNRMGLELSVKFSAQTTPTSILMVLRTGTATHVITQANNLWVRWYLLPTLNSNGYRVLLIHFLKSLFFCSFSWHHANWGQRYVLSEIVQQSLYQLEDSSKQWTSLHFLCNRI